jgi:hypothetical protein
LDWLEHVIRMDGKRTVKIYWGQTRRREEGKEDRITRVDDVEST